MGKMTDFLGDTFIAHRLDAARTAVNADIEAGLETVAQLREGYRRQEPSADGTKLIRPFRSRRAGHVRHLQEQALWEQVAGAPRDTVRDLYRRAVTETCPCYHAWDWPLCERTWTASSRAAADEYARLHGSTVDVDRKPGDKPLYVVRYQAHESCPDFSGPGNKNSAFRSALLAGDEVLALDFLQVRAGPDGAAAPPVRYDADDLLAALVRKDDSRAAAILRLEPGGYAADTVPERREFLHGILEQNPNLVREGAKLTTTRFKGMWDRGKWAKKYRDDRKWQKRFATPELFLDDVRKGLVSMRWLLADFGVICMGLAARRGMADLLLEKALFSEWLPLTLAAGNLWDDARMAKLVPPAKPVAVPQVAAGTTAPAESPALTLKRLHDGLKPNPEKVRRWLEAGGDVNTVFDNGGWTPLHAAVRAQLSGQVDLLLQNGADVNAVTHAQAGADKPETHYLCGNRKAVPGMTPLHVAVVVGGKAVMVEKLVTAGADPNLADSTGMTPLAYARKARAKAMAAALQAHGAV